MCHRRKKTPIRNNELNKYACDFTLYYYKFRDQYHK